MNIRKPDSRVLHPNCQNSAAQYIPLVALPGRPDKPGTGKTSNGFNVVLTPASGNIAAGTFDVS
jgi:hypothetical protein